MLILFLSGCAVTKWDDMPLFGRQNLDVRLTELMTNDCVCDYGDCACMDRYTGDSLYIDCSNTTVESLVSVLHDCDYGWNMSGDAWQKP